LVATPDGLRAIEEIEIGDLVLAWDEETGRVEMRGVTGLIRPDPKLIWRLEARDADQEAEVFYVTDDHPWFAKGMGWVETKDLRVGQALATADKRGIKVLGVAATDRAERTYNLTVDGFHTFLVGEDGAVVHNCPEPKNMVKEPESAGNGIAQKHGYKNAHDAKDGLGPGWNIYRDKESGQYFIWDGKNASEMIPL
jgi:hypothetical protein